VETILNKAAGCMFGPAEFLSYNDIVARWPLTDQADLEGDPALVTDDTQMAIAVGEALIKCKADELTPESLEPHLRSAFVDWFDSPDNDRAPGRTCMRACNNLKGGGSWIDATIPHSKGCGANMRVAPVGLLTIGYRGLTEGARAAIAQFQAALTHGHPTALAASDLTCYTIAQLVSDTAAESLPGLIRQYAESQRSIYHEDWLGELWRRRPNDGSGREFIETGWDECLAVLDRLDAALADPNYVEDPCLATGAGWIAEEAFATGLLCFLMFPKDPRKAVQRAAATSGDSDSIACLTGAFAGAHLGIESWPPDWIERIEYRGRLDKIVQGIANT
jgi:ADP-ribosylglycohydrolase